VNTNNNDVAALLGRILLAFMFVVAGWGKLTGFAGTVGYVASAHVPMPEVATALALVVELGGGLLLVFGWKARWAALALAGFTLVASLVFHDFWNKSGDEAMTNQLFFFKNVAVIGGMLMVFAFGPGRLSLDRG
jgi:putative oxidoreductase